MRQIRAASWAACWCSSNYPSLNVGRWVAQSTKQCFQFLCKPRGTTAPDSQHSHLLQKRRRAHPEQQRHRVEWREKVLHLNNDIRTAQSHLKKPIGTFSTVIICLCHCSISSFHSYSPAFLIALVLLVYFSIWDYQPHFVHLHCWFMSTNAVDCVHAVDLTTKQSSHLGTWFIHFEATLKVCRWCDVWEKKKTRSDSYTSTYDI